jgi:hypothetical protein
MKYKLIILSAILFFIPFGIVFSETIPNKDIKYTGYKTSTIGTYFYFDYPKIKDNLFYSFVIKSKQDLLGDSKLYINNKKLSNGYIFLPGFLFNDDFQIDEQKEITIDSTDIFLEKKKPLVSTLEIANDYYNNVILSGRVDGMGDSKNNNVFFLYYEKNGGTPKYTRKQPKNNVGEFRSEFLILEKNTQYCFEAILLDSNQQKIDGGIQCFITKDINASLKSLAQSFKKSILQLNNIKTYWTCDTQSANCDQAQGFSDKQECDDSLELKQNTTNVCYENQQSCRNICDQYKKGDVVLDCYLGIKLFHNADGTVEINVSNTQKPIDRLKYRDQKEAKSAIDVIIKLNKKAYNQCKESTDQPTGDWYFRTIQNKECRRTFGKKDAFGKYIPYSSKEDCVDNVVKYWGDQAEHKCYSSLVDCLKGEEKVSPDKKVEFLYFKDFNIYYQVFDKSLEGQTMYISFNCFSIDRIFTSPRKEVIMNYGMNKYNVKECEYGFIEVSFAMQYKEEGRFKSIYSYNERMQLYNDIDKELKERYLFSTHKQLCGNGICDQYESLTLCPQDCKIPFDECYKIQYIQNEIKEGDVFDQKGKKIKIIIYNYNERADLFIKAIEEYKKYIRQFSNIFDADIVFANISSSTQQIPTIKNSISLFYSDKDKKGSNASAHSMFKENGDGTFSIDYCEITATPSVLSFNANKIIAIYIHELGHCFGFDDLYRSFDLCGKGQYKYKCRDNCPKEIMNNAVAPILGEGDKAGLRALYGKLKVD